MVSPDIFLAVLLAIFSLTSCGGKGNATDPSATYAITASSGANGTVIPVGATTVVNGTSQTYTITPTLELL